MMSKGTKLNVKIHGGVGIILRDSFVRSPYSFANRQVFKRGFGVTAKSAADENEC
jgi:hypothetical protein